MQQMQYTTQQPVQQVQLQYPAQQPVTIIAQPAPQPVEDKFRARAISQMTVLCSLQLVMGILCFLFGIVLAAALSNPYLFNGNGISFFGYGIWNGINFIIVGGVGMAAAKRNGKCWIISTMVLNIICSVIWCGSLIGFTAIGLITTGIRNNCNGYSSFYYSCDRRVANTYYALDSLMLIMGIIQFGITIWCACLCCGAVCRCCKGPTNGQMVQYSGHPVVGQQVVYPNAPVTTYQSYPVTQTGVPVQQGYAVGVHQQPVGGYAVGPPTYTAQGTSEQLQASPQPYPTSGGPGKM